MSRSLQRPVRSQRINLRHCRYTFALMSANFAEQFNAENNPLFQKAVQIANAARAQNGRALLVGGFVRDALLGASPKDADMEIYGIEAERLREMLRTFGKVDCVGESFRVYKLAWWQKNSSGKERFELDVSLPRRDKKIGEGHKGFEVEGDPFASIEDASRRRDFTVNAILLDPLTSEILDPFGGREDLERRVLRVTDVQHFAEDSLRVLRAVQFAARFEMQLAFETIEICRSINLDDLPRERIWGEVEKWLMKSNRPSIGLLAASQLGVLEKLFPYLQTAFERREDEMRSTLDRAAAEKSDLPEGAQVTLMLAAIGVFIGRSELQKFLETLGVFKIAGVDVRKNAIVLAGERKRVRDWFRTSGEIEDKEFRYLSARVEPRLIDKLARARGDFEAAAWFWQKMSTLGLQDGPPAPLLMGRDLLEMGLSPGPRVGEILQTLWARQLAGELSTPEAAHEVARELIGSR